MAPMAAPSYLVQPISAHPSNGSWHNEEVHLRPQWPCPHTVSNPFQRTPHTVRCPIGSSTEGHSGRARIPCPTNFRAPLPWFVI